MLKYVDEGDVRQELMGVMYIMFQLKAKKMTILATDIFSSKNT